MGEPEREDSDAMMHNGKPNMYKLYYNSDGEPESKPLVCGGVLAS